jgi:hypothetical protein
MCTLQPPESTDGEKYQASPSIIHLPSSQRHNQSLKKKKKWCIFVVRRPDCRPSRHLSDNTVEALLEPLDGLVAVDAVGRADSALAAAAAGDTLTGAGHAAVEIHTVDTDRGVVLDAEIDVLADTEAKVTGLAEVALAKLVLLDLEATLEDLLGLGATDGDVDSDLLVTADTEGTDGVAGLACWEKRVSQLLPGGPARMLRCQLTVDGSLTAQLLQDLGGTGQSVTRFTDRDVEDELLDLELPHGVLGLLRLRKRLASLCVVAKVAWGARRTILAGGD